MSPSSSDMRAMAEESNDSRRRYDLAVIRFCSYQTWTLNIELWSPKYLRLLYLWTKLQLFPMG